MRRAMITGSLGAIALAAVVAGCSGSAASPTAPPATAAPAATAAAASTVDVSLQEWAVVPAKTSAAAGSVTFNIKNTGPADVHEMVVVKTDLEPGALPVNADGSINEEGEGVAAVGGGRGRAHRRLRARSPWTSSPGSTCSCATSSMAPRSTSRTACERHSKSRSRQPTGSR